MQSISIKRSSNGHLETMVHLRVTVNNPDHWLPYMAVSAVLLRIRVAADLCRLLLIKVHYYLQLRISISSYN